jgi:hypothetical protein
MLLLLYRLIPYWSVRVLGAGASPVAAWEGSE